MICGLNRLILLAGVVLFGTCCASRGQALEVAVKSDPKLPVQNVLDGKNANGKVGPIFVKEGEKNPWRVYPVASFKPGIHYVASCRIKPSAKVSSKMVFGSGLGFSLGFWDKDWRRSTAIEVHGDGVDCWRTIVGEPVLLPDWIANAQLHAGLNYSPGEGWVDDLRIVPADANLWFGARSHRPIRQVKVLDGDGKTVFDSGILKGDVRDYRRQLTVNSAQHFIVMAVDESGDVAVVRYPKAD